MVAKVFLGDEIIDTASASVSIFDLSIHRAYGIFDYFKMLHGYNPYLDLYLDRLYRSLTLANLTINLTGEEVKMILQELLIANEVTDCGIKIIVSAGASSNGYERESAPLVIMIPFALPLSQNSDVPFSSALVDLEYMRDIPEIKTTNYMYPGIHSSLLKKYDAIDFLFHDGQYFYESSRCNVFIVKNGTISTPGKKILEGITRARVIGCRHQGFDIQTPDRIKLEDLYAADEVFITSTTKTIVPIVRIGDKKIDNGHIGEITRNLQELVKDW